MGNKKKLEEQTISIFVVIVGCFLLLFEKILNYFYN